MDGNAPQPSQPKPSTFDAAVIDAAVIDAAADVQRLIEALEPTLDAEQRRLLHELRLAAETLGTTRAAARMFGSQSQESSSP